MGIDVSINSPRSAIVSLDLQVGVVSHYVKDEALMQRVAHVLRVLRDRGLMVIHVKVAFRPGVPEASSRNFFLSAVRASLPHQRFFENESGRIHPAAAPSNGDLVVTKSRVSAFAGTDLDQLLRANDRDTLIVFGILTSGAVLSTVLEAADKDYRLFVIKDCCVDADETLHTSLMDNVFPRQATILSANDFGAAVDRDGELTAGHSST
jgi:nicotinamidase-related amidase